MRIKHWQGYGIVNAVKVKDKDFTLAVHVSGNHEWGLRRDDTYDLFNWLVKRFDKSVAEISPVEFCRMRPEIYIAQWDYEGVEHCLYKFRYSNRK